MSIRTKMRNNISILPPMKKRTRWKVHLVVKNMIPETIRARKASEVKSNYICLEIEDRKLRIVN